MSVIYTFDTIAVIGNYMKKFFKGVGECIGIVIVFILEILAEIFT